MSIALISGIIGQDSSHVTELLDLHDQTTLRRIITKVQPDEFYHLARQSHVGLSFEIPETLRFLKRHDKESLLGQRGLAARSS